MKGLITKVKNPKRKNIVLYYQEELDRNLKLFQIEWEPMSESQINYIERTEKNVYYAPYVLGYAEHLTPEEKIKLEKIIASDRKKAIKEIKDAQKEQEAMINAVEALGSKEDKKPVKRAKKPVLAPKETPVKEVVPTKKPVVKKTATKTLIKKVPAKTSVKKTPVKKTPAKPVAKKPVVKTPVKKTATKKPPVKKPAAKKPVVRKKVVKKK